MSDEPTKTCTRCGQTKRLSDFYKHKLGKYGRRTDCKACRCESQRKYREADPEKARETDRKYREANREKVRERKRKRYEANPEKARERDRKYREANPEKVRESNRKCYRDRQAARRFWQAMAAVDAIKAAAAAMKDQRQHG
jgi:hypothetical protein